MTFEQAFEKAAMERFEEVKMASLGNVLKQVGGFKGLGEVLSSGKAGKQLGNVYRSLSPEQQAQLIGQGVGAAGGLAAGIFSGDSRDSTLSRFIVPAAMSYGGMHLGKALGGMAHGFKGG